MSKVLGWVVKLKVGCLPWSEHGRVQLFKIEYARFGIQNLSGKVITFVVPNRLAALHNSLTLLVKFPGFCRTWLLSRTALENNGCKDT